MDNWREGSVGDLQAGDRVRRFGHAQEVGSVASRMVAGPGGNLYDVRDVTFADGEVFTAYSFGRVFMSRRDPATS